MNIFSASFLVSTFVLWVILRREFTSYKEFATVTSPNGTLPNQIFGKAGTGNTSSPLDGAFGIPKSWTDWFSSGSLLKFSPLNMLKETAKNTPMFKLVQ